MSINPTKTQERIENPSRRRLFSGQIKTLQEIRLPWVINEAVFTSGCTQCQDCINSCESNIIIKGMDGFPKIDFNLGECTFCNKCIDICEQPLFSGKFVNDEKAGSNLNSSNNEKAWPVTLAISDKCLAKNNIYCQSCRDECETSAIKFNYVNSSIPEPSVHYADCTQCGACLSSCPQGAIAFIFDSKTN